MGAAIVEPWSNGQTEGEVTPLKLVKRQLYGPGNIDLLCTRMELCRKLGDDDGLKAAYRGGCPACQNLSERAIRLWKRLPTSSAFVIPMTSTTP